MRSIANDLTTIEDLFSLTGLHFQPTKGLSYNLMPSNLLCTVDMGQKPIAI